MLKKSFELRRFSELPTRLRERAVDLNGENIEIDDVSPDSRVCIESSPNPGTTAYVLGKGETFYDLCKMKFRQLGKSMDEVYELLSD